MMKTWTTEDVYELIASAYDDCRSQLFYAIENYPPQRDTLCHQLDVLNMVKEQMNARIDNATR